MAKSVLSNTGWLTGSAIVQKLISFAYFTLIARLIGVENTGQYFFAISFTTIFTVVADFGLGNVLTREGAKFPQNLNSYVNTILSIKLAFGVLAYLGVFLVSSALNYAPEVRLLILLSGVTMFFDNIQTAFYSALRSQQNLFFESAGNVAAQLITLLIGTVALIAGAPLYWLILAYTIPSALICVYGWYIVSYKIGLRVKLSLQNNLVKGVLVTAAPFAAASIIGRLYSYSDLLLMSKLLPAAQVGWWSVPYKIVYAFQFIPAALSASLYPAMSALYAKEKTGLANIFSKSIKYLALFSVPLAAFLYGFAEPVVDFLYGPEYAPSFSVLKILALSLVCTYTSLLTGALLNATDRQSKQTALIFAALVINVTFNLIFMPTFGVMAAAGAALAASLFLMIAGLRLVKTVVNVSLTSLLAPFFKFMGPAVIAVWLGSLASQYVHFLLGAVIAGAIYLILVAWLGLVKKEEFAAIIALKNRN